MYYLIDNYDSFVYNLAAYFQQEGAEVVVLRNDVVSPDALYKAYEEGTLQGIILSPGPKRPEDSGLCLEILERFEGLVPILGVCLGHQTIAYHYGAKVVKGQRPMHGKISRVKHNQMPLFTGLPGEFAVTRYHSLMVADESLPECLCSDAFTQDDGAVMAIHHRSYPVYGVQFHPEAVLTEYGHKLVKNFISICGEAVS